MSIEQIHLRKLLQLLYARPVRRLALIRADIRSEIAKESGIQSGGGDFFGPFWTDVKDHVFGVRDIREAVLERVTRNGRRDRLYPALASGFLKWWDQERRWTNEPFIPVRAPNAVIKLREDLRVKIENVLAVRDGQSVDRYIYPYFCEEPSLQPEAARIGLWILKSGFAGLEAQDFRILDVIRGNIFSLERNPLEGDEAYILHQRYENLVNEYDNIRSEY